MTTMGITRFLPKQVVNLFMIAIASLMYAVAIKYFVIPSKVILTGFEGIGLSLAYYLDDISIFLYIYIFFQCSLLIFSLLVLSKRFAFHTGVLVLGVVTMLPLFPEFSFVTSDTGDERMILVLFGGLIAGAAKALAFKHKGSTGDEDVIATYISHKKLKPVGNIAFLAGGLSIIVGLILTFLKSQDFETVINTLMYTSLYLFISTVTLNRLFKKYQLTKLIIVSRNTDLVTSAITSFSGKRTYTLHEGIGGYSKQKQSIISVIIPHDELQEFLKALKDEDPSAFIYYHDIEGVEADFPFQPIAG